MEEFIERKRVLLVDDEKNIEMILRGYFLAKNCDLDAEDNVIDALKRIESQSYDLLILDMKLKGDKDGLEVLKAIKNKNPGMGVIVLTGYYKEYKKKLQKLGCNAILEKPISFATLSKHIDETLPVSKDKRVRLLFIDELDICWTAIDKENFDKLPPGLFIMDILTPPYDTRDIKIENTYEKFKNLESKLCEFRPDIVLIAVEMFHSPEDAVEMIKVILSSPNKPKDVIVYGTGFTGNLNNIIIDNLKDYPAKIRLFSGDDNQLIESYWDMVRKTIYESAKNLGLIK